MRQKRADAALTLQQEERLELEKVARSRRTPQAVAQRARIVLLTVTGVAPSVIGQELGVSQPTMRKWRARYAEAGLAGLRSEPRPGRPRTLDDQPQLAASSPPKTSVGRGPIQRALRTSEVCRFADQPLTREHAPERAGVGRRQRLAARHYGRRGMRQGSISCTGSETRRNRSRVSCTEVTCSPSMAERRTDRT